MEIIVVIIDGNYCKSGKVKKTTIFEREKPRRKKVPGCFRKRERILNARDIIL